MKTLILSDIHLEFHKDEGRGFLLNLSKHEPDLLILAGDICTPDLHETILSGLSALFPKTLFVLGNHDYYGSEPKRVEEHVQNLVSKRDNLFWLDNNTVEIGGQKFFGGTLWFKDDPHTVFYSRYLNDFSQIKNFVPWVYQKETEFRNLIKEVTSEDVVITHHLPTHKSNKGFQNSPLTRFFVNDLEEDLYHLKPKLWVHGHTHKSSDYVFSGGTRILCNPLGYPRELNPLYKESLLEI